MKKLKIIALAIVVLIGGVLLVASFQPDDFKYERSTTIAASRERIYGLMVSLREFEKWNPYAKMDPAMKSTFEGPESGIGAINTYEGDKIGAGRLTIVNAVPNQQVEMKLEFFKPMESTAKAIFTITEEGGQPKVSWTMTGTNNLIAKAMHMFIDMDTMMATNFDKGLADLKGMAESTDSQLSKVSP